MFCPPCLTFHRQHPKAASADCEQPRERKSAKNSPTILLNIVNSSPIDVLYLYT